MEIKENENGKEIVFSEEDVKRFIKEAFDSSQTIEEAIEQKREQDRNMEAGFIIAELACSTHLKYSNSNLFKINVSILSISLLKLFCYVTQNGQQDLLNELIIKMQSVKEDVKSQKALLKDIKRALIKLKRNKIASCTVELCKLIAYLFTKQQLVLDDLVNYMSVCKLNVEGIECHGTNKNQEELKELDENINNSIKTLGLRK